MAEEAWIVSAGTFLVRIGQKNYAVHLMIHGIQPWDCQAVRRCDLPLSMGRSAKTDSGPEETCATVTPEPEA